LYSQLEDLLADHDEPLGTGCFSPLAFTALEIRLLDQLVKDKGPQCPPRKSISIYLTKIASRSNLKPFRFIVG